MLIKIGLENDKGEKSIAWVIDHPGCFVYGKNSSEAILRVPQALVSYQNWIGQHTSDSWLADLGDFDVRLVEVVDWNPAGNKNSHWFESDRQPLLKTEVSRGLQVLAWSRADLLELVSPLSEEELDHPFEGERRSIHGILDHIASVELHYLEGLGLAGMVCGQSSRDVFERLKQVREGMNEALASLIGSSEIREVEGNLWSGRKLLRRTAWHEKDHILHILRLLTLL